MLLTIWVWLDGEIGRRPRFKLWCPEMDVWVRIPLKLLIIKEGGFMKELLEELKKQYEGNSVMEAVAVSIAYKIGYSEGFAAGEEAMKNLIDKLTSPTISN